MKQFAEAAGHRFRGLEIHPELASANWKRGGEMKRISETSPTILCVGVAPAWFGGLASAGFAIVETWPEVIAVALRQNPDALLVIGDRSGERNLSQVLEALRSEPKPPPLAYFSECTEGAERGSDYRNVLHFCEWTDDSSVVEEAVLHRLLRGSLKPAS
jgi:hypothetical protein